MLHRRGIHSCLPENPTLPDQKIPPGLAAINSLARRLGLPKPDAVVALSMRPEVSRALIEKRCAETGVKKDIHEANTDFLKVFTFAF